MSTAEAEKEAAARTCERCGACCFVDPCNEGVATMPGNLCCAFLEINGTQASCRKFSDSVKKRFTEGCEWPRLKQAEGARVEMKKELHRLWAAK